MTIETKYDVNDEVSFLDSQGNQINGIVVSITVKDCRFLSGIIPIMYRIETEEGGEVTKEEDDLL